MWWRSQMNFFSWFKNESICPNVRALNATIFIHSTPNSIFGKKYYVWRLQVSYLVDLSTSPYVLMLERWMLPFSYIRRPTVLLVRDIVYEDRKWVLLTWFKHEFIFPDVRTLNATIFVHSTPNIIIGRGYCVGRSQKSFLAHLSMTSLSWSSSVECYHFRTFNAKQYYW